MHDKARDSEKVVIIGAGIAGLCAGVYARKNGFEAAIVEMAQSSGGLATSWQRGDYVFETCLHWLLGSKPGNPWHDLWNEVFDIDSLRFVNHEEYARLETENGATLALPRNVEELEAALLRAAPEDAVLIHRFARGVRKLASCDLPLPASSSVQAITGSLRMLRYLPEVHYWSKQTMQELAEKCRNPLLRALFSGGSAEEGMAAIAFVFSLAWMGTKNAGYPIGGSRAVIDRIEKRFLECGGHLRFGAKVNQILVKEGRARGVRLTTGEEILSDWVISAADGHSTIFNWIPAEYRDQTITEPYQSIPAFPSYVQVSFGIGRDMRDWPPFFTRLLQRPISVDPKNSVDRVAFRVFHFDPTFAPPGKTAVTAFLPTFDYQYWLELQRDDPLKYQARKAKIADEVMQVLERRSPGLSREIELIDVSTPSTVMRFTGNWKGSMEGFQLTPSAGFQPLPLRPRGLEGFLMVGQWVMPGGGLPSGLLTARLAVQQMCKKAGRPFQATGGKPSTPAETSNVA